ncbi:MAG: 50S ribosomal protein L10 [Campylobacteraceae bacterium]|jgi:large subunit ribosomal protein L10|nr:50S ribosomal protein L10 [Campylobacteraceae bacterium]MBT3882662.1 50S ribosomal protein L10 [Campylobacteraceae bacterium]MBT4030844.1 50S ribosomal protein L10 [Campylobacteraceae bacterium]MBT4179602.1 50S ribosomal protein L10 [Campylobacteraceae bacterium]MBT4572500.1 50S ribosomal protein L10 [Campylobacteraceae bacterium]
MTKLQKNDIVNVLTEEFKSSQAIVVANYKGTSHKELEELRIAAKEAGAKVQVAKNTLVQIAVKNAELEELTLSGTNIFVWAEDQIAACKVADKFASSHKDTFAIKTGIVEGKVADVATINALAKLPGREELLGMLAATWMAPVANFTIGLDALRKQKEESA